jgi:hypothetical protein
LDQGATWLEDEAGVFFVAPVGLGAFGRFGFEGQRGQAGGQGHVAPHPNV